MTITNLDINAGGLGYYGGGAAGLECLGDATIILKGENKVRSLYYNYPGIYVPQGSTLTIQGDGSLEARGDDAAGIGGGWNHACGNIVIAGGTIVARGGSGSPAIGGGMESSCGDITIADTVTSVTAYAGEYWNLSIGYADWSDPSSCGTVTIGGVVYPDCISESPFIYAPVSAVDLSKVTESTTIADGETVTGTLGANVKISIADGATVTLKDVAINGVDDLDYWFAGITCEGNATIILEGSNTVRGFQANNPGIFVPYEHTLTIKGDGSLDASSNGNGAGIGGAYYSACGNIVIEGGTITATGGDTAAGIGGGGVGSCGTITIADTVTKVTAIKGENAPCSIGKGGDDGTGGTVTIGGTVYPDGITQSPYAFAPVDLANLTEDRTIPDGATVFGTLANNVMVFIADGATVTLKDVDINGAGTRTDGKYAGINCLGDATIILAGSNTVKGFDESYPGIHVPEDYTLTITGDGSLDASSNGKGAGIGGGNSVDCGNIVIAGGTIAATGGTEASGIGGGSGGACGDITISQRDERHGHCGQIYALQHRRRRRRFLRHGDDRRRGVSGRHHPKALCLHAANAYD